LSFAISVVYDNIIASWVNDFYGFLMKKNVVFEISTISENIPRLLFNII